MDGRKVGFSREGILKTRVERGGAAKRFGKGKLGSAKLIHHSI